MNLSRAILSFFSDSADNAYRLTRFMCLSIYVRFTAYMGVAKVYIFTFSLKPLIRFLWLLQVLVVKNELSLKCFLKVVAIFLLNFYMDSNENFI